nr:hypothetical protein [Saccharomonospora halophila]
MSTPVDWTPGDQVIVSRDGDRRGQAAVRAGRGGQALPALGGIPAELTPVTPTGYRVRPPVCGRTAVVRPASSVC